MKFTSFTVASSVAAVAFAAPSTKVGDATINQLCGGGILASAGIPVNIAGICAEVTAVVNVGDVNVGNNIGQHLKRDHDVKVGKLTVNQLCGADEAYDLGLPINIGGICAAANVIVNVGNINVLNNVLRRDGVEFGKLGIDQICGGGEAFTAGLPVNVAGLCAASNIVVNVGDINILNNVLKRGGGVELGDLTLNQVCSGGVVASAGIPVNVGPVCAAVNAVVSLGNVNVLNNVLKRTEGVKLGSVKVNQLCDAFIGYSAGIPVNIAGVCANVNAIVSVGNINALNNVLRRGGVKLGSLDVNQLCGGGVFGSDGIPINVGGVCASVNAIVNIGDVNALNNVLTH